MGRRRWRGLLKEGEGWQEQQSRGGAPCQAPLPGVGTGPSPSRRVITHTSLTAQSDPKALWHVPRGSGDAFLPASLMERLFTKIKPGWFNSF